MSTLLDTNVVSELMRASPEPAVARWVSGHPVEDVFLSAVSEAELRYGAAILPVGRRRETLLYRIEAMLRDAFEDRVLPFDSDAARTYGPIAAWRRSAGRPVASADCQIAAIAAARRMRLATRNVRDFEGMGIDIVDPWAGK
ncbi:MAG: type II toxin-antitoxin system VapC family toxin [Gemmatimonadetes bacterium]|nr:type II toxin-antitoxin system VapC family toxin [Gemmatimonadota bacterium]MYE69426.1 type II toxin-antitoxin system VapC family toxin [Gemmatimonadota bacterium]MYJ69535.1 type II toxin-antitoxin system VapC family toxin [Gemmatimonadota bacterium]